MEYNGQRDRAAAARSQSRAAATQRRGPRQSEKAIAGVDWGVVPPCRPRRPGGKREKALTHRKGSKPEAVKGGKCRHAKQRKTSLHACQDEAVAAAAAVVVDAGDAYGSVDIDGDFLRRDEIILYVDVIISIPTKYEKLREFRITWVIITVMYACLQQWTSRRVQYSLVPVPSGTLLYITLRRVQVMLVRVVDALEK